VNQECADEALNEKEQKEKDRSIGRKKRFKYPTLLPPLSAWLRDLLMGLRKALLNFSLLCTQVLVTPLLSVLSISSEQPSKQTNKHEQKKTSALRPCQSMPLKTHGKGARYQLGHCSSQEQKSLAGSPLCRYVVQGHKNKVDR
jgi:hypothetical protein